MTIPRISPYTLPAHDSLPDSRAEWPLEAARSALLVHDVQSYFVDFFDRREEPICSMLTHVRELTERARALEIPVFYTAQPPEQSARERGLLTDLWGPGITGRPAESLIEPTVAPHEGDRVITKWRYSAFQRTNLAEQLVALGRDQLLIVGVYAHIGCLLSAAEAFMRDIQPFLISDAVADFSPEHHERALAYVAGCCGRVLTTSDALSSWQSAPMAESLPTQPPLDPYQSPASAAFTYDALVSEVAALMEVDPQELQPDDNLLDWGLDSIRLMTLVERWRSRGADVSFPLLAEQATLSSYWALISEP